MSEFKVPYTTLTIQGNLTGIYHMFAWPHNNVSMWITNHRFSIWYDAHYNEWAVGLDLDREDGLNPGMYVPISGPHEECPDNVQNEWRLFDGVGYLQLPVGYVFVECVKGKFLL